jgi:hypothetical protein
MKNVIISLILVFAISTSNAQDGPLTIFNNTSHAITIRYKLLAVCPPCPGTTTGSYWVANVTIPAGSNASLAPVSINNPCVEWRGIEGWHTDLNFTFIAPFPDCVSATTTYGYLQIAWFSVPGSYTGIISLL